MCHRFVLVGLLTFGMAGLSAGQEARAPKRAPENKALQKTAPEKGAAKAKEERLPTFTPEREAAALSFVRQHHEELAELLAQLKSSNPREYERATHELFRTSERLALSKERDPSRYELELKLWKLDSRIQLLAARMSMSEQQGLESELRGLLLERIDVQLEQQLLERQRVSARLERLEASIAKLHQERDAQVQKSLDKILRGIAESRPEAKPTRSKNPAGGASRSATKGTK